jgi:geranylgeranyl reductase family protein
MPIPAEDADVVVVGAGPAGSTTAYHLACAGLDVVVCEKASFPREKVCGDGLTPRAVKELIAMGVATPQSEGWIRNHGLRILGGGMRIEMPWPELSSFPSYGLVRPRQDFDEVLARAAQKAGARLREATPVLGPLLDERTGRVVGVSLNDGEQVRAPLTVVADGNSSRFSLALGIRKRDNRPMGVAYRRYYRSPRHDDDWLESWLELWDGPARADGGRDSRLLPGYGWIFGVGDGTSNVGLGILNTSDAFGRTDYKALLESWLSSLPPEWGFTEDNAVGPVRGAALPMGFNRKPHYRDGALLVGDAGGMVNPMNGEGIAYAMESGRIAAEVIALALAEPSGARRERVLAGYPQALDAAYGGYYTIGRLFVRAIGHPSVMKLCARHGLPHPTLMKFCLKLLANLAEPRGGDAFDRIVTALNRLAPAA